MAADPNDDRTVQIIGITIAMIALSTLAVILRWWPRLLSKDVDFWWDDWTALGALPFTLALNAITLYWVSIGFGKHMEYAIGDAPSQFFTYWILNIFYNTALSLVKVSVLFFYARVFRTSMAFKIALWIMAFLVIGWWVAIDVLALTECSPTARFWYRDSPGECLDFYRVNIGTAIPNACTDFILLVMPLPMLWSLKISVQRKLAYSVVFMFGYSVFAISILRLIFVLQMGGDPEEDITWNVVTNGILLCVECSVAIISICLPRIFNMLRKRVVSFVSSQSSTLGPVDPMSRPPSMHVGSMIIRVDDYDHAMAPQKASWQAFI